MGTTLKLSPEKESAATNPLTGNHRGKKGTYLDRVTPREEAPPWKNTLLLEDP